MKSAVFVRKLFFLLMLGCMCLAGCSRKEGGNPAGDSGGGSAVQEESDGRGDVRELSFVEEALFQEKEGYILGIQFFQGEAIQLRCVNAAGMWIMPFPIGLRMGMGSMSI